MKEYKYIINGNQYNVTIGDINDNIAQVEVNGTSYKVELEKAPAVAPKTTVVRQAVAPTKPAAQTTVVNKPAAAGAGKSGVKSPLPGVILDIKVNVGDTVNIIDEIFDGFSGVVEEIDLDNNMVKVTVSALFGKETTVELELDQVELAE